ncbi:MAG: glycosyltransferase family 4 protein, partial [Candidatus Micrarchaeota archaeon]|nr:glycosyltransferase family 4 protein [Candidatus Micrarchaeota archaeon]
MKIAMGIPNNLDSGQWNGFITIFRETKAALSGHQTTVFAPSGGDVNLKADLLDTHDLANIYKNTMEASKDFAKRVNGKGYDAILAFTCMGLFLSKRHVYYTSNMPYKRVLELVKGEYPDTPCFRKLIDYYRFVADRERENYEKAEKIIVCSRMVMKSIVEDHDISPEKIVYAPRQIPKLYQDIPEGKKEGMRIILMPAELRVMKGVRYAIEAMKLLKREVPNAVLVISGRINRYEQEYIDGLLNEARGKANIIVTGFLKKEQLYGYMRNAECAFMPFCFDECPISLAECIGHGLPVVTNEYAGYDKEI